MRYTYESISKSTPGLYTSTITLIHQRRPERRKGLGEYIQEDGQHKGNKIRISKDVDCKPVLISVWLEGGHKETFKVHPPVLCDACRKKILKEDINDSGQFSPSSPLNNEKTGFFQKIYQRLPSFGSRSDLDVPKKQQIDNDSGIYPDYEKGNASKFNSTDSLDDKNISSGVVFENPKENTVSDHHGKERNKFGWKIVRILPNFIKNRLWQSLESKDDIEAPVPEPQYIETQESFPELSEILGDIEGDVIVSTTEADVEFNPHDFEIAEYDSIVKQDTENIVENERPLSPDFDLAEFDISIELPEKVKIDEDMVEPAEIQDELFQQMENLDTEHGNYIIHVKTGNVFAAGTDSNVHLFMSGDNGESEKILLEKPSSAEQKSSFQRNQLDIFYITTFDVGDLNKIRISTDGKGWFSAWYLENILVYDRSDQRQWEFKAYQWLDGKRVPEIELFSSNDNENDDENAGKFTEIEAKHTQSDDGIENIGESKEALKSTSESTTESGGDLDTRGSGDDVESANRLEESTSGSDKKSRFRFSLPRLTSLPFQRSKEDNANDDEKSSEVQSISNDTEAPVVPLKEEEVESSPHKFEGGGELGVGDSTAFLKIKEDQKRGKLMYKIIVRTGKEPLEESSARVFIFFSGEKGDTEMHNLFLSKDSCFKKNGTDTFFVEDLDVGELNKIRIGCDKLTFGVWSLETVIIEENTTNSKWSFPISQKLTSENHQCDVKLQLSTVDDENSLNSNQGFKLRFPAISWPSFHGKNTDKDTADEIEKGDPSKANDKKVRADDFDQEIETDKSLLDSDNSDQEISDNENTDSSSIPDEKKRFNILSKLPSLPSSLPRFLRRNETANEDDHVEKQSEDPETKVNELDDKTDHESDPGDDVIVPVEESSVECEANNLSEEEEEKTPDKRGFGLPFSLPSFSSKPKTEETSNNSEEVFASDQQPEQLNKEPRKRSIFGYELKIPYFGKSSKSSNVESSKILQNPSIESRALPYQIAVYTSDFEGAGTDANIFISLIGENGEVSEERCLTSSPESRWSIFKQGSVDVFMRKFEDVGTVRAVRITIKRNLDSEENDCSNSSSWHLEKIILTRLFEYDEFHSTVAPNLLFEGNSWFDANSNEGIDVKDLEAATLDLFKLSKSKVTKEMPPSDLTTDVVSVEGKRLDTNSISLDEEVKKKENVSSLNEILPKEKCVSGNKTSQEQQKKEKVIYIEEIFEECQNPDGTITTTKIAERDLSPSEIGEN